MIIDTLDNADAYGSLGQGFATAFDYLRSGRAATDEPGIHKLDGDDVFASVQDYTTKPIEQGRYEAHKTYADVQFVASGNELIGYAPLASLSETDAYNADDDIAFYSGKGTMLRVPAGTFTVFWPQDGHMPCIAGGSPGPVRKVVVKVRING